MNRHWLPGDQVEIQCPSGRMTGQVWDKAPQRGQVWIALSDRTFVLADKTTGNVFAVDSETGKSSTYAIGKVAA